jgi:amino acid transporter
VMPAVLRRVDPRTGNPWAATLVMGLVNLVLLALTLATSSIARALGNVVSSLGLIAVLFYGLTAAAAVWQGRGTLARSAADLIAGGVLPGFGVLFMAWVLAESVRSGAASTIVVVYGMGSVALGAVIAFVIHRMGRVEFFRRGADVTATALHNSRDARREHELS